MSAWSTRELIAYLDRVEPIVTTLSHFELLDVTAEDDEKVIREAFFRKASSLHPDLYRLHISHRDLERLTTVYARIAQAYLVLRDPTSRKSYARRAATEPAGPNARRQETDPGASLLPPRARRMFNRAQASLRTGDYASAILNLKMAIASAPESAMLREALADVQRRSRSRPV